MKELITKINLTPIEVALQIDEEGRTTAKKLYTWLELDKSNYSKWLKRNITDNDFVEEGVDFYSYQSTSEGRGNFAEDYIITAKFAKKLCMKAPGIKGEQTREYFTKVEDKLKEVAKPRTLSVGSQIQIIAQGYVELEKKIDNHYEEFTEFKQNLPLFGIDMQVLTETIHKVGVTVLGGKDSYAYKDASLRGKVYSDIHIELKRQYGVTSYKEIPRSKLSEAIEVVENYQLPIALKDSINTTNNQVRFEF